MIIGNPKKWEFTSRGFEKIFLPLSDTCTSNDGETVSPWPGQLNVDRDKLNSHKYFPLTHSIAININNTQIFTLHIFIIKVSELLSIYLYMHFIYLQFGILIPTTKMLDAYYTM